MTLTDWADVVRVPENRAAVRAGRRLVRLLTAGRFDPAFAPLVLHGPPGVGKSHVAAAVVRAAAGGDRTASVVAATEFARPDDEPDDYRSADLLVIEDVHRLPASAADALGRLLDARANRRRPTVLTANAGPAGLTDLPRRLTSRLAAGLVVPLEPLSADSRRAVLTFHADRRGLRLTPAALAWLADRPTGGGARPLLGLVETLRAADRPGPLDRPEVERLLADDGPPLTGAAITAKVAAAFGVAAKDVVGASRLRPVLLARQVGMYLAREVGRWPLVRVGEAFGGRDHSTVLHAVKKVAAAMEGDPAFAATVKRLAAELV